MAYIDTIDIIYQARIRYFSTANRPEAYYLGRQGLDIYQFARRGDNPELLQKAFDVLGKSIELDPRRAHPNNLQTFMGVTQMMFENEMLENEDVINNYGMLMDILDERIAARNGAEDKTAKETIDLIFKSGGAATCEGLIPLFTQRVQDNPNDLELLKKVINLLNDAGCNDSDLYYTAAESLYQQEKSATAAYHLAEMNADKMDYDKAEEYYKEAISMEEDQKNIANYYIKMATFRLSNKDYQIARDYAKEAIKADPDNGTAYMLVGNAYSAVQIFDDDIQNQMIFWVAADYFRTAKQKDPELAERCDGYISSVAQYFPKKEDLFFISIIEEGVEHKVGGWINETTTVRFRQEN
jgi:tetratricopeptide (TPR) repeat protein